MEEIIFLNDAIDRLDHIENALTQWNGSPDRHSDVGSAICAIRKALASLTAAVNDYEMDQAREGAEHMREAV
jgi:hypothetical protein